MIIRNHENEIEEVMTDDSEMKAVLDAENFFQQDDLDENEDTDINDEDEKVSLRKQIKDSEIAVNKRAIVLGVYLNSETSSKDLAENSLAELIELAETAGLEVVGQAVQYKNRLDSAYAAGSGKLEEVAELAKSLDAETIVLDLSLTGSQMRNISELTEMKVLDRTLIILDIFALRAKTKEGCLQVEIAQLNDRATRLTGAGKALSRLGGGIGTRGPGETKLEMDRRHIQRRIKFLKDKLKEVRRQRELTRNHRDRNDVTKVAVVGYTNAGKSTLLNALCDADVETMDQVFATLDPTARKLSNSDIPILLIDTVGFIRKLPHQLVEAFKSTLDEVTHADIILQVTDIADPEHELQMDIVEKQLEELKADAKPRIQVFNKIELVDQEKITHLRETTRPEIKRIFTSAKEKIGLEELRESIIAIPKANMLPFHLVIPYEYGGIVSELQQTAMVEKMEYINEGVEMTFKIKQPDLGIIAPILNNKNE